MFPLASGTLSTLGATQVLLPVPLDPRLVGLELYLQAARARGGLNLTNSAMTWVR